MKRATSAALALILTATTFAAAQTPNSIRYSNTTPAAPTGAANVQWQNDNSSPTTNISAYALYPTLQVACPTSGDLGAPINAALAALPAATGGTVDARRCSAATTITSPITFTLPHTALLLPCSTLTTAQTISITASAHNSLIAGCAYSAGSPVSGSSAGSLISYTGSTAALIAGDPTHTNYTNGLLLQSFGVDLTNAGSAATAIQLYAVERYKLDSLYISGNNTATQTGIYIDGTGWYSSGLAEAVTMQDIGTGYTLTGHLLGGTRNDYVNFSTFISNQIWCADNSGTPIAGTTGIVDNQSYGNIWIGGGLFRCSTPNNSIPSATPAIGLGFYIYP